MLRIIPSEVEERAPRLDLGAHMHRVELGAMLRLFVLFRTRDELLLCVVDLASKVGVELILLVGHAALEHSHMGHHGHAHGDYSIWDDVGLIT